jgi:hypothetical protein
MLPRLPAAQVPPLGFYDGGLARAVVLLKHEQIEPLGKWFAK